MFELLSFMLIQGSYPEKPHLFSSDALSLLPDLTDLSRSQLLRATKEANKKAYLVS